MNTDYILVEGQLSNLKDFVTSLENNYAIDITKKPTIGLTMVRAKDSVEHQEFYLGEVLITETEVSIAGVAGIGICTGDQPARSYCIAVIDALLQIKDDSHDAIMAFLKSEQDAIIKAQEEENNQILKTKVNFKLMDQS